MTIAYLRQKFKNPFFYQEDLQEERKRAGRPNMTVEEIREWPHKSAPDKYYFSQIDGATDKDKTLQNKIEYLENAIAEHRVLLMDELGELFFAGLEETLRPVLTDPTITTYATAQNFHSKGNGRAACRSILAVAGGKVPECVVNREVLRRPGLREKLAHYAT